MLELLFYGILYIIVEVFSKIMEIVDNWLFKPKREQKQYDETVQWFETHDFFDAMSPYIQEYLETGKLNPKFYEFEDELISMIGNGNGLYPDSYAKGLYQDDWKKTILSYRKSLIKNLKQGKDYRTSKGIIRIVKIHHSKHGLRIEYGADCYICIDEDTVRFASEIPKTYIDTLGHFGFTFIPGQTVSESGWSDFEIVAYVNLGKDENS